MRGQWQQEMNPVPGATGESERWDPKEFNHKSRCFSQPFSGGAPLLLAATQAYITLPCFNPAKHSILGPYLLRSRLSVNLCHHRVEC
jgi:hypothetical protein